MKVAIVHYHLEPGGVTRVIENTLLGWKEAGTEIETVVFEWSVIQWFCHSES